MKKLYHLLAMLCIVVTLALAGLAVSLRVMGRLSAENCRIVGKLLRGQPLAEPAPAPMTQPAASQPAIPVAEQVTRDYQEDKRVSLVIERRKNELKYLEDQLVTLTGQARQERQKLKRLREKFAGEIEASKQAKSGDGFKKQLKLFKAMKPEQVKEALLGMPEAEAVQYLASMKERYAAGVIKRFKSPAEKTRLQELLKLMREQG